MTMVKIKSLFRFSALRTKSYVRERAGRGDLAKALAILDKASRAQTERATLGRRSNAPAGGRSPAGASAGRA